MRKEQKIIIISFTDAGSRLNAAISRRLTDEGAACLSYAPKRFVKRWKIHPLPEDVKGWIGVMWGEAAFLFIGAAGIAVRYIAPWVRDKYTDSAVVVMDEKGEYVIPLLSGHVGGAVELARHLSERTGAVVVTTTATDVQGKFAVDIFAEKNGLKIQNRELVKKISAALLEQIDIGFYSSVQMKGELPEGLKWCDTLEKLEHYTYSIAVADADEMPKTTECITDEKSSISEESSHSLRTLWLTGQSEVIAGIGCRKGARKEMLESGLKSVLKKNHILPEQVIAFASIDLKKNETGLIELAEEYEVPFQTFTAEELGSVKDVSAGSAFVKQTTGVDNVCERAALYYCPEGTLIQPKVCIEGAAYALVKKSRKVTFQGCCKEGEKRG